MARRPFDSQYEDPYDPWPQDRQHWLVWLIFFAPGSLITWKEYMFPERGQVWASGRRAHNKIVQVLYSLSFWFTLLAGGYAFYHMHQMKLRQNEREAEARASPFTTQLRDKIKNSLRKAYADRGYYVLNVYMNNAQGSTLNGYVDLLIDGQHTPAYCQATLTSGNGYNLKCGDQYR